MKNFYILYRWEDKQKILGIYFSKAEALHELKKRLDRKYKWILNSNRHSYATEDSIIEYEREDKEDKLKYLIYYIEKYSKDGLIKKLQEGIDSGDEAYEYYERYEKPRW